MLGHHRFSTYLRSKIARGQHKKGALKEAMVTDKLGYTITVSSKLDWVTEGKFRVRARARVCVGGVPSSQRTPY